MARPIPLLAPVIRAIVVVMPSSLPPVPAGRERPAEAGTGGTTLGGIGCGKLEGMTSLRRAELADFLRSRRARLRPTEVGLPEGVRRRTPGLRRQEVAQLAGMSIDYYIRLEQGRGPHPSGQILAALARALLLTRDERAYLFRIAAGDCPPEATGPSREVTPGLRHLLDAMTESPAYLVDAAYEVLAWNRLATWFVGELSAVPADERNMIRWMFRRAVPEVVLGRPGDAALRPYLDRGPAGRVRPLPGRPERSRRWSPSCSGCPPGSPRSGPSTRSASAARPSSGSTTPSWGRWSSSAGCCTSRRPTSG